MSTTQTNANTAVATEVNNLPPGAENMEVTLNVNNDQCAVGVQVNGPGQVSVGGDVVVKQEVTHNHMEECQVDRFVKNVKNESNKTAERVSSEVQRSGKKVEAEFKRFKRRF